MAGAVPRTQVTLRRGGRSEYRDLVYGAYGVVVETDGRMAHLVTAAWRDAHRDNSAAADGFLTLRYSWSDVNGQARLLSLLSTVRPALSGPILAR